MSVKSFWYLGLISMLLITEAIALTGKQASYGFGYAMQAAGSCKNIIMRLDTEAKLEAKFGIKLRGQSAPYDDAYTAGLLKAIADEGKGLCKNAWSWYGCAGTKHPRLLIESPFNSNNPKICPY